MIRTLADMFLIRSPVTSAPYRPDRAGEFFLPRAALAVADAFAAFGTAAGRALSAWERRIRRRDAIRELSALDDRMLSDIGIGRSEIPAAVDAALEETGKTPARAGGRWQA